MARPPLHVQVVSAEREVWSGEAVQVIARTTEGDIGILPGHEPILAVLVPSRVEIVTGDGRQQQLFVDEGFISVAAGRVSVLAHEALLGEEISAAEAQSELDSLVLKRDQGEASDAEVHRMHMLKAQLATVGQIGDS